MQFAINNSVNISTDETHFLLYGYDKCIPCSLLDGVHPGELSHEDYISYRTTKARQIIKKTREQLKRANGVSKGYYDRQQQPQYQNKQ